MPKRSRPKRSRPKRSRPKRTWLAALAAAAALALLQAEGAAWATEYFSCPAGKKGACCPVGKKAVCIDKFTDKIVDRNATCFKQGTCGYGLSSRFVCKKDYDESVDDYNALVRDYNSLIDEIDSLERCVANAGSLRAARSCL